MEKYLKITDIKLRPRAREDLGDVPDLARKIMSTKGLKGGNITVEELNGEYFLLAGGRRLAAYHLILSADFDLWQCQPTPEDMLPYSIVPCTVLTDLTDSDRIRIELIENMGRKDFTWQEAAGLVQAFHSLMQEKYGKATSGKSKTGWGTRDTARELGLNPSDTIYYLKLHEGLATDPTLKDIRQKSKAITKLKRNNQGVIADLLAVDEHIMENIQIVCGDSREVVLTIPDESVDLVITDPPWGIDFESRVSSDRTDGTTSYDVGYDIMDTLDVLTICYNKMKPNTSIYMFYSAFPEKVLEGQKLLVSAGFNIEHIPLLWYKKHILAHNSQETKHNYNYEVILYGWKGERPFFTRTSRNVFEHQIAFQGRIHSGEKPEALLAELIALHTTEDAFVLDPFGGSCKLADACLSTNRRCMVVELEEALVKMAMLRVRGI